MPVWLWFFIYALICAVLAVLCIPAGVPGKGNPTKPKGASSGMRTRVPRSSKRCKAVSPPLHARKRPADYNLDPIYRPFAGNVFGDD